MMLEIICHACPETGCAPRDRARMESAVESAEEEFSPHQVRDHLPCRALMMSTIRYTMIYSVPAILNFRNIDKFSQKLVD